MNSFWDLPNGPELSAGPVNVDLQNLDLSLSVGVESGLPIFGEPRWAMCMYENGERIAAWDTAIESTLEDATAALAEMAQDIVMGTYYRLWPECPLGSHPLSPKVEGKSAVWCCEREQVPKILIGQLSSLS